MPVSATICEKPVVFACAKERLLGILTLPAAPATRGVLVVVGGPQYRVGSHRQFTLLARILADAGFACMRFDARGMGDSTGEPRNFEHIGEDLASAIDAFTAQVPVLEQVVLWGLCDAASAALMFGASNPRVAGLALLNPWVRSDATLSQTRIKHYYPQRLVSPELWSKALCGKLDWRGSAASFLDTLRSARSAARNGAPAAQLKREVPFQDRMAAGLLGFAGPVLLIVSGNDLTAKEFLERTGNDPVWQRALSRSNVSRVDMPRADHTFSQRAWRMEVERATLQWLERWEAAAPGRVPPRRTAGRAHG
jgi:exosortase A-associated hydrolase 1